jgi:hypothetical protein
MKLEELLLKKEEIPILPGEGRYYRGGRFFLPIYPKLLDADVKIDPLLANKVFPKAAKDWFADLKKTLNDMPDSARDHAEELLKKKISVKRKYGRQVAQPVGFEDQVTTLANGFVKGIAISSSANSLYVELNSPQAVFPAEGAVKFSTEKFEAYCCRNHKSEAWYYMHLFHMHNPGNYTSLLFLRNWGILYVNEALKQVFGKR